jgi:hypothetical protein
MSSVTFSTTVGGDGSTVTDDDNATTGLGNGGALIRLVPMMQQAVNVAAFTVNAAESVIGMNDLYLGSYSSNPTLNNSGGALIAGNLYFNDVSDEMRVYTGSSWVIAYVPAGSYLALSGGTLTGALAMTDQILSRAMFKDVGYTYYNSGTTNALDYVNGSHQRWTPNTGAQTLSITNWSPTGNLSELLIEGVNLGAATITFPTINWIKSDGTTTTTFSSNGVTLQTSGTDWLVLWTRDAGTTIYGKVIR